MGGDPPCPPPQAPHVTSSNDTRDPVGRSQFAVAELDKIVAAMERRFQEGRRVLSFHEYLELFAQTPARFARDAARYVLDMFDHFGTVQVQRPWGELTRYRLFDLPWDEGGGVISTGAGRYHQREFALV